MFEAMTRAGGQVVPATLSDEAVIDNWRADENLSVRLIMALVAACRAEPKLNAWFDGADLQLAPQSAVNVGIAVDAPEGLFVPVLHNAESLDGRAIADRLQSFKEAARQRTLSRAQMSGATITLSNFGSLAGRFASLVVVPPQVAIVGAGRIHQRPAMRDGSIVFSRILPLSLTFDHRVLTGGEVARFMRAMIDNLEAASTGSGA